MSLIDTRLAELTREAYLAEIRAWLPAFLSSASSERLDPLEHIADLLALDLRDLKGVMAVHVILHPEVQAFIDALKVAMGSPTVSSHRPRQLSRAVVGGIDWSATIRARATSSPLEGGFVTRPAVRLFDVPENRVLAWVLRELDELARGAVSSVPAEGATGWVATISRSSEIVGKSQQAAWLRGLPKERPLASDFAALASNRRRFYRILLRAAAERIRKYAEDPSEADVAELLTQRWFEPARDWQLFELAVLLRIERAIKAVATRTRIRPIGHSGSPFAIFQMCDGGTVRLWYQTWPGSAAASEQQDAARHYKIASGGSRPDIVLEVRRGAAAAAILLELKATRSGEYLGAGLLQLLSYLRDRPALFMNRDGVAWLVAPTGGPFESRAADGRQLWVVGADAVGAAARDGVTSLSAALAAT